MTLLEAFNTMDRFAKANGITVTQVSDGYAVAEMTVTKNHLNAAEVCQGGALFTLADVAMATVMNTRGLITLGLENTIIYHASAVEGNKLTAKAFETFNGRKIPSCRVEIYNEDGLLIASGTSIGYRKAQETGIEELM